MSIRRYSRANFAVFRVTIHWATEIRDRTNVRRHTKAFSSRRVNAGPVTRVLSAPGVTGTGALIPDNPKRRALGIVAQFPLLTVTREVIRFATLCERPLGEIRSAFVSGRTLKRAEHVSTRAACGAMELFQSTILIVEFVPSCGLDTQTMTGPMFTGTSVGQCNPSNPATDYALQFVAQTQFAKSRCLRRRNT